MKFGYDSGPHIKSTDNTAKIMKRLLLALLPIIIFSIYKNGILPYMDGSTNILGAIKPLMMIIFAILTSVLTELIFIKFILKKKSNVIKELEKSFSIFPGLFLALVMPINSPLWIIILGAFIATFIGKLLFGGFGFNVFNPALVGVVFVFASYGSLIALNGGYLNPSEMDAIASATPLSNLANLNHVGSYSSIVSQYGNIWNYLFGFIPGALGETPKILIIISFIYLAITKTIKWIIPVIYVGVVFIMTYIIGSIMGFDIWYPLVQILSGGLLFGAVFMATDPVTSPTSRTGQILFGLCLGLLTVIFRFTTSFPEGVLTAILTMNMLVIIIDKIGAKASFNKKYLYIPLIIILGLILSTSIYIGKDLSTTSKVDNDYKILDVKKINDETIYNVTQKGFHGLIEAKITFDDTKIIKIDITKQNESLWNMLNDNNYLHNIIEEQSNLSNVDTVSGATITSNSIKSMIDKTVKDFGGR